MDQREADSVCFAQSSSLSAQECVSQHFFLMCPIWSVTLSLSLSLSLWTTTITRPRERLAWQWCDGAAQTVKMDCYPWRFANTHIHTCMHSPILPHTIAHMHDNTITECDACTRTHGPMNLWACQPKVAHSDKMFQLETGQGRHHGFTASNMCVMKYTHTLNIFHSSIITQI